MRAAIPTQEVGFVIKGKEKLAWVQTRRGYLSYNWSFSLITSRNTYRSALWETCLSYRRWNREFESQKSKNFPKGQRCYVSVEELRLPNTKIATAAKTMTLKNNSNKSFISCAVTNQKLISASKDIKRYSTT